MKLLISKPLFAICQKRIFYHFTAFHPSNFYSMSVRFIKEAAIMADRGVGCILLQIYQYWTVYNLLKMRFVALSHK